MTFTLILDECRMECDSSIEDKTNRGFSEAISYGMSPPSDGMIEFQLKLADGVYTRIWMSCENARGFCNMLHRNIRLHDVFGKRNVYKFKPAIWDKWLKIHQNSTDHAVKSVGIPNLDISSE